MDIAEGCYRHIKKIFQQLEEFRAFELLRSGLDRSKYLLIKEAKIIAMTCTHAALKRRDLVEVSFQVNAMIWFRHLLRLCKVLWFPNIHWAVGMKALLWVVSVCYINSF